MLISRLSDLVKEVSTDLKEDLRLEDVANCKELGGESRNT